MFDELVVMNYQALKGAMKIAFKEANILALS